MYSEKNGIHKKISSVKFLIFKCAILLIYLSSFNEYFNVIFATKCLCFIKINLKIKCFKNLCITHSLRNVTLFKNNYLLYS